MFSFGFLNCQFHQYGHFNFALRKEIVIVSGENARLSDAMEQFDRSMIESNDNVLALIRDQDDRIKKLIVKVIVTIAGSSQEDSVTSQTIGIVGMDVAKVNSQQFVDGTSRLAGARETMEKSGSRKNNKVNLDKKQEKKEQAVEPRREYSYPFCLVKVQSMCLQPEAC